MVRWPGSRTLNRDTLCEIVQLESQAVHVYYTWNSPSPAQQSCLGREARRESMGPEPRGQQEQKLRPDRRQAVQEDRGAERVWKSEKRRVRHFLDGDYNERRSDIPGISLVRERIVFWQQKMYAAMTMLVEAS